jgi:DNA-directed RNA polymerase subunit D
MKLKLLDKQEDQITFLINETEPYIINAVRRTIIEEVPTMAIEEVVFVKNNSALYDEIISHRLGLLPLTTDLKGYNLMEDCKCKGKGCARCQIKLILEAKGPCTVYSENLKSKDPKVKPAFANMPITKLLKGQNFQLEVTARLGRGKEHTKFTPGLPYYRSLPILTAESNADLKKLAEKCKNVTIKGKSVEIKNLVSWNEADEQVCEENGVKVEYSDTDFIFTVESWGHLPPKEIVTTAIELFNSKLKEFDKLVK